ncbi:MAG: hypothetical protein AB7V13_03400 [Pseudorhodoplanes sp.]|uniref:hypothetical protein n=1 Tax=Pseudorhodoplanes sp. TaxID=1934341 RepID=UPI003D13A85C
MAISWFCQWDAKDGGKPVLDAHDHQGLVALIRGCPRLVAGHIMTPVHAHDPHYAADLHNSPALVLQLEFAEIADLEHALKPHGYLQALAHEDLLPSLADATVSHHAMLTRRYPVAEAADEFANGRLSYMVEYEGPARDANAWHLFYVTGHPPLLAKFPGIRRIEIYTPALVISALPFGVRNTMQRNKTVWDNPEAMNAAMASPVRAALRKDFHRFPEFEGAATHYPFRTVSVRGERYRPRD